MVHYYNNRELARKLEINLARWKRWSRSFLPPDPLGGMQSGYARQYLFKDLFKVYLGGYLLGTLKLSVAESQQVIGDLSPWLKKNGFFDLNGSSKRNGLDGSAGMACVIFFSPNEGLKNKNNAQFRYLVRQTIQRRSETAANGGQVVETYVQHLLNWEDADWSKLLDDPEVRMINLGALLDGLIEKLGRP